jgi:hypothetical protein
MLHSDLDSSLAHLVGSKHLSFFFVLIDLGSLDSPCIHMECPSVSPRLSTDLQFGGTPAKK